MHSFCSDEKQAFTNTDNDDDHDDDDNDDEDDDEDKGDDESAWCVSALRAVRRRRMLAARRSLSH